MASNLAVRSPDHPPGGSVIDSFYNCVASFPDRAALVADGQVFSYSDLAVCIASVMNALGDSPVDRPVCVYARRSSAMVIGSFACLARGIPYSPVEGPGPIGGLKSQLEDLGAEVILVESVLAGDAATLSKRTIVIDGGAASPFAMEMLEPSPSCREGIAYIMYTSGSTGRPKGVVVPHASLQNYVFQISRLLGCDGNEQLRFAMVSSFATDLANTCLFPALTTGGTLYIAPTEITRDPLRFADFMSEHSIQVLKTTPSHLSALIDHPSAYLSLPQKCLVLGGEVLRYSVIDRIMALAPRCSIINHYGPTETTVGAFTHVLSSLQPWRNRCASVPIGSPLPHVKYTVLSDGSPADEGELYIGGDCLATGYWNRDDLTEERFVRLSDGERYYRTGDICRVLEAGVLEFLGRADRQIKIRGYRVEPGEVEALLATHPCVQDAAVVVTTTGDRAALHAFIVPRYSFDAATCDAQLREYYSSRFPQYLVPSSTQFLRELPRTGSGKINYRSLREDVVNTPAEPAAPATSASDTEFRVRQVWERCLNLSPISSDADFFELGGDSIVAIQISAQLLAAGLYLSPQDFYRNPTVGQQAQKVTGLPTASKRRSVPGLPGLIPLTPIQSWFFKQRFPDERRWAQVLYVLIPDTLNQVVLEQALAAVLANHEALRTGFSNVALEPGQFSTDTVTLELSARDFSQLSGEEREAKLVELVDELLDSIQLDKPPLLRAAIVTAPPGSSGLLLVAHHLIVDAVSWLIILSELQSAYHALIDGSPAALPAPTQFRSWAKRVSELAPAVSQTWHDVQQAIATFPCGDLTEDVAETLWIVIPMPCDSPLGHPVSSNHTIYEAFLASISISLNQAFGIQDVVFDLESHGREDFGGEIDLRGSVGWFTSLVPLKITLVGGEPWREVLACVKRAINSVRLHGIPEMLACDLSKARPPICVNYLGRFHDSGAQGFRWRPAPASLIRARGPMNPIGYELKFTGCMVQNQLHVSVMYSRDRLTLGNVSKLVTSLHSTLSGIIRAEDPSGKVEGYTCVEHGSVSGRIFGPAPCHNLCTAAETNGATNERVLLTGATGFLGVYVLRELLLRTNARIYCLIRASADMAAPNRLFDAWEWAFPGDPLGSFADRIRVVAGDLSQDDLCLSSWAKQELAAGITSVFNVAADTRLIADDKDVRNINASGARRLLEFAKSAGSLAFHQISTLSVFGDAAGEVNERLSEDSFAVGQNFGNAYERSKFEAEEVIRNATFLKSAKIYRFGNLAAHSKTGRFQRNIENNRVYLALRGWLLSSAVPDVPTATLSVSYVDVVARAIVALSREPGSGTHVYHVENPGFLSYRDLLKGLRIFGYGLTALPVDKYEALMSRLATNEACLLGSFHTWGGARDRANACDSADTIRHLARNGIVFPRPSLFWLRNVIRHAINVGFIPPPHHWADLRDAHMENPDLKRLC